jgi:predicted ferric reductase
LLRHREAGASLYIQIARGAGACLNFDCALIVLPMLRKTLTRVRRSVAGALVPVDEAVRLHAMVGETIVVLSLIHTAAHVANLVATGTPVTTAANSTGAGLLLVLGTMWAFARDAVRRTQRFELFYFSHLGYFAFVALLLLHGPRFYLGATVPWLWFLVEKLLRVRRTSVPCRLLSAEPLASGVTKIVLERPEGFSYAAGDYAFLCIPALAPHEYHPFTLTSAPEDPATLTFHVRAVGNWTRALRERLPGLLTAGTPSAQLDGPHGTASRRLLQVPHAIAIAGGIGVTPFASILQSLLLRSREQGAQAPGLRKLHFVWLARDQEAFEWFTELLASLEQRDARGVLDAHVFMTKGRADMAGGMLELAQHLLSRRSAGDVITGLRSPTGLGAPDFDALIESFCAPTEGDPELPAPQVFFCGPSSLERVVKRTCLRLGLRMRAERF